MDRKGKGSWRERQTRDFYAKRGALITKAGGSLGALDLVVLMPEDGIVEGVQVKSNRFPGRKEMTELAAIAKRFESSPSTQGWKVVVARWIDRVGLELWKVQSDGSRDFIGMADLE